MSIPHTVHWRQCDFHKNGSNSVSWLSLSKNRCVHIPPSLLWNLKGNTGKEVFSPDSGVSFYSLKAGRGKSRKK